MSERSGFYERALKRIRVLTLVVGAAGGIALLVTQGPRSGLAFCLGAALSVVNFQGISALAEMIGGTQRPKLWAVLFIGLRYLVLGFAVYVIVRILRFAPVPVLGGLLAPFGAAVLEILYELIFPVHA